MSLIRAWAKRAEMVVDIPSEVVDDEHQPNVSLRNNSLPTANKFGLGIVDHERVLDAIAETTDSRGKYHIYTPEIRFKIGKFASESNSSAAAVRKFRDRYPNMNESTVRGFRKKYEHMLKKKTLSDKIPSEVRGRPLLLGHVDMMVQQFIVSLRNRGGFVSRAIAVATANVLLERCQDPALRCIVPTLGWAKSLYQRMGFKRRATTTAKLPIPEGAKEELKILFLTDIVTYKEKYNVPESLILNLDQTSSKLIQTSRYTWAKGGSKDIPLADKRTITATFVISLSGNFLPIQSKVSSVIFFECKPKTL